MENFALQNKGKLDFFLDQCFSLYFVFYYSNNVKKI